MADISTPNALTQSHTAPAGAGQSLMVAVAKRFKVSPFKQFAEMFRLRGGACQISTGEYYEFELYRPDLPLTAK